MSKSIAPSEGCQPGRWQSLVRRKEGREFQEKGTAGWRLSNGRGVEGEDRRALLDQSFTWVVMEMQQEG